ncbi:MAG: exodeoxyribonuclease I [Pseudomonadota bacterium]
MSQNTLYWHDYETFGTDPKCSRPAQFAGIRTDEALNIIGEPLIVYCCPSDDMLPEPAACLVTGITPQKAAAQGVPEIEFIGRIHQELSQSGTCGVGYNSIRFDDEFTRYTLYRNFYDPYAREWKDGNSRWDIIDMVRLTWALRPEDINWPKHEDGKPSFRLEHLTVANDIEHADAHDALADVHATIAIAKLIKTRQPRLYDYLYRNRFKRNVAELISLNNPQPLVHTSRMFPSEQGGTSLVMALAQEPGNKNGVVVFDLRYDPEPLLELHADEIRTRLFTATANLPDGVERMPLKMIHLNRAPVIAPMNTLDDKAIERIQLDMGQCMSNFERLLSSKDAIAQKLDAVYQKTPFPASDDPDQALYSGGFFSNTDRQTMESIRKHPPEMLEQLELIYEDERIPEMLFRYKARNYPDSLSPTEQERWLSFRQYRLMEKVENGGLTLPEFRACLDELKAEHADAPDKIAVLNELETYGNYMEASRELDLSE